MVHKELQQARGHNHSVSINIVFLHLITKLRIPTFLLLIVRIDYKA